MSVRSCRYLHTGAVLASVCALTMVGARSASAGPFDFNFSFGTNKAQKHTPRPARPVQRATPRGAPRAAAAFAPAAAPPPAGTGRAQANAAPTQARTNVPWVDNLPTAQFVVATIRSTTPWDEAMREHAALRSLSDYVSGQISLSKDVPMLANVRKREYDLASEGKGDEYYWSERWHEAVLQSFIQLDIANAYMASPAWQTQLGPIRAREGAAKKLALEKENQTKAAAAKTVAVTSKAKVDRTVFGIALGEPLTLPACTEERPQNNCLKSNTGPAFNSDPFGALAQGLQSWVEKAATTGGVTPPGMAQQIVVLGSARCPNWVMCQMVVTTKNGYALAATFQTSLVRKLTGANVQDDVARNLFAKYHVKPVEDGASECNVRYQGVALGTSSRAKDWQWSPPGLSVHYTTFGNPTNCDQGRVDIQTSAYTELSQAAAEQEQAAQPTF